MKNMKLIIYIILLQLIPIFGKPKTNEQAVHTEFIRFLCPTENDFKHDLDALKIRLKRIRQKNYQLTVGKYAVRVDFQKEPIALDQFEELLNSGRIEIMAPADGHEDKAIKPFLDEVTHLNDNLRNIVNNIDLTELVWEKFRQYSVSKDYEFDILEHIEDAGGVPIKLPNQILIFRKLPLIGPEHIQNIAFYKDADSTEQRRFGLTITLTPLGKEIFRKYSSEHRGLMLPMYIDRELISAPMLHEPITEGVIVLSGIMRSREFYLMIARLRKAELYKCRVTRN